MKQHAPVSPPAIACGLQAASSVSGLSPRKLSADIAAGLLPSVKRGRRRLVLLVDLEQYLRAGRSTSASAAAARDRGAVVPEALRPSVTVRGEP